MSAWGVHGAADTALRSWSSFDEMTWDEFGDNGDHIVPETEALTGNVWTLKDDSHRKPKNEFPFITVKIADESFQKSAKSYLGLESSKQPINDLITQQAVLPSHERTSHVPGNVSVKAANTRNRSGCLTSLSSGSNGASMEASNGCTFESTNYEFEDSDYQDNGPGIVDGSCHFSLSEICPPGGDLELFGVPEDGKGGNLLEYGWGNTNNLEYIDKLFLNDDPLLPQTFDNNSDGILWESSSTVIGSGSIYHSFETQMSPESRALKGDLKGLETKMEFVPCNIPTIPLTKTEVGAGTKGQSLPCTGKLCIAPNVKQTENYIGQSTSDMEKPPAAMEGLAMHSESMEDTGPSTPKEAEKASKAKRHSARRKRTEDRPKKQVFEGKSVLSSYNYSQANSPQLPHMPCRIQPPSSLDFPSPSIPRSQILQSTVSESPISRQCSQPVSYVHAGFGFPAHHMPIMVSGASAMPQQLQQVQPVFNSYQPLVIDASKSQKLRNMCETSSQPLVGSSTMTRQEKIEKLRWRQKMQARLAVENQQQTLINQHLILEPKQVPKQQQLQTPVTIRCSQDAASGAITLAAEPLVWSEGSVTKAESIKEVGDDSLAATVLQQLIDIASELDTRTRLCLRDSFHRLAGSAMQRRAVADGRSSSGSSGEPQNRTCGSESSSNSEQSTSNRRVLTVADIVETETNQIDRFIAHLLFHKRHPSTLGPVYMSSNSCAGNSQEVLFHQSPWAWQMSSPPTEVCPAAVPSGAKCSLPVLQGAPERACVIMDVPECNNTCLRLSETSACQSSAILQGISPVQPKAFSSGLIEGGLVDGSKEACPDCQNSCRDKSVNNMIRNHALYKHNEGAIGTFAQKCLQQESKEARSPPSGLAMDKHLPGGQKGPLISAAGNSGTMLYLSSRAAAPSDISLRCTIKEDVDSVLPGTSLCVKVDNEDMVLETHAQVKKEPSSPVI